MRETIRRVGGAEGGKVKGPMEFIVGDVLKKEKSRHKDIYYLITRTEEGRYYFAMYDDELFREYRDGGSFDSDYLETLVFEYDRNDYVDYKVNQWSKLGHVSDLEIATTIDVGEAGSYYAVAWEHLQKLNKVGFDSIESDWLLYQTAGNERMLNVVESGRDADDLAHDMLRLSPDKEPGEFVETESNVLEAIGKGIWVPIKPSEPEIDGTKETVL